MKSVKLNVVNSKEIAGFKYLNRGYEKSLVLIPGWASDYRIFENLDLKFNYLLPIAFSLNDFTQSLLEFIKENKIGKVSLFGWSMGGFFAADFASKYPGLVEEIILVGIRKQYEEDGLLKIKNLLVKNKRAYLYGFYKQCFYNTDNLDWFKQTLFKSYCEKFDLEYLLVTLNYLAKAEINSKKLKDIKKATIIHGENDNIAPIDEAKEVAEESGVKFISIKKNGHIPFLNKGFKI